MTTSEADVSARPFTTGNDSFASSGFSETLDGTGIDFGAKPVIALVAPGKIDRPGGGDTRSTGVGQMRRFGETAEPTGAALGGGAPIAPAARRRHLPCGIEIGDRQPCMRSIHRAAMAAAGGRASTTRCDRRRLSLVVRP